MGPRASAPVVFSLPRGLQTGGVTTWAVRTAGVLARRGRAVCLVVHREDAGSERLKIEMPASVRVVDLSGLAPLDEAGGRLSAVIPPYRDVVRALARETGRPAVVIPALLGDSFGVAAALSLADPESLRVVGWCHSPIAYDAAVLDRYEAVISRFVAVSDPIAAGLRSRHPSRAGQIDVVYHGVEVPPQRPARPPLAGRALMLVYAGRVEDDLKRVVSLVSVSDALRRAGVPHRLTIVGDGPAAGRVDGLIAQGRADRVRRLSAIPPDRVAGLMAEHDLFVLPSRVEGMPLAALEAMAVGCVPVMRRTETGSRVIAEHGVSGVFVEVADDADDEALGEAFAAAIAGLAGGLAGNLAVGAMEGDGRETAGLGLERMSEAGQRRARERFSMEAYADAAERVIEAAATSAPRAWPADRPCAFTTSSAASGSGAVPPGGAERLKELLAALAGRRVVVHGVGRHTLELSGVLAWSEARIVAFADDDPSRQGGTIWNWPIVSPSSAGRTGASDVVISSWMNQEAIWDRRGVYERQGMTVHRVYDSANEPGARSGGGVPGTEAV